MVERAAVIASVAVDDGVDQVVECFAELAGGCRSVGAEPVRSVPGCVWAFLLSPTTARSLRSLPS